MKKHILLVAFLLLSGIAAAQKNVVKLNVSKLFTLKAELAYERTFLKQFSVQVGLTTQIPMSKIPGGGDRTQDILDTLGYSGLKFSGYWITPEVRFYLNPIKGSPKGLYLAAFGRISNRIFNLTYTDTTGTNNFDVDARLNVKGFGGGLMLGHQWIIAKHISIDIYMIGLGVNKHDALFKIASTKYPSSDYSTLADEINGEPKKDGDFFSKPVAVADGQSIKVTASSVFPIIRSMGFNIGIAF
jgi:hypothetical protein